MVTVVETPPVLIIILNKRNWAVVALTSSCVSLKSHPLAQLFFIIFFTNTRRKYRRFDRRAGQEGAILRRVLVFSTNSKQARKKAFCLSSTTPRLLPLCYISPSPPNPFAFSLLCLCLLLLLPPPRISHLLLLLLHSSTSAGPFLL